MTWVEQLVRSWGRIARVFREGSTPVWEALVAFFTPRNRRASVPLVLSFILHVIILVYVGMQSSTPYRFIERVYTPPDAVVTMIPPPEPPPERIIPPKVEQPKIQREESPPTPKAPPQPPQPQPQPQPPAPTPPKPTPTPPRPQAAPTPTPTQPRPTPPTPSPPRPAPPAPPAPPSPAPPAPRANLTRPNAPPVQATTPLNLHRIEDEQNADIRSFRPPADLVAPGTPTSPPGAPPGSGTPPSANAGANRGAIPFGTLPGGGAGGFNGGILACRNPDSLTRAQRDACAERLGATRAPTADALAGRRNELNAEASRVQAGRDYRAAAPTGTTGGDPGPGGARGLGPSATGGTPAEATSTAGPTPPSRLRDLPPQYSPPAKTTPPPPAP